ncbi:MAG: glycosyltransferase [Flavitalea sp.]
MELNKKKILIFADWFEPGFRAGGPIRSVANFVHHLRSDFDLYVVTSNSDFGSYVPYEGIQVNQFIRKEGFQIMYTSPGFLNLGEIDSLIKKTDPQIVYLNSMFSLTFSLKPLIACSRRGISSKVVLAPRGMLKPSALHFKRFKKFFFLRVFRLLGFHKHLTFQATSESEVNDIKKVMGERSIIALLPNLPSEFNNNFQIPEKIAGKIRMIFVGRIHPIKNLDYILKILQTSPHRIELTIIGNMEVKEYWNACKMLIATLPFNITVNVLGEVPHSEITQLISNHHLFMLLTRGENFGYSIYESLCTGRPVLISDQTPWQDLETNKAGWALSLKDPASINLIVDLAAGMGQAEYDIWATGAYQYAKTYFVKSNLRSLYIQFFSNPIRSSQLVN